MEEKVPTSLVRAAARHWFAVPALLLVALLTLRCASLRWLWADEFMTLQVARAGGLAELWQLMATGPQSDPPLFYLASRASMAVLGENPVAFRLPSLLGGLLLCVSLYAFAARRVPPAYAGLALVYPLFRPVGLYTYEARPYGLWLGWSGLALLCWQVAGDSAGWKRRLAVLGLAACSALMVSTHYYAVLVLAALGLAELVRAGIRRRIDLPVGLALAAAVVPLLAYRPLIANARSFVADSWAAPSWETVRWSFYWLGVCLGGALLVHFALPRLLARLGPVADPGPRAEGFRPEELVAGLALAGLPVLGLVLAATVTNNYHLRYVLPAVCGFTVLTIAAAHRAGGARQWPGRLLTALAAAVVLVCSSGYLTPGAAEARAAWYFPPAAAREALDRARTSGATVVTDSLHVFVCEKATGTDKPLAYVCGVSPHNEDAIVRRLRRWYGGVCEPDDVRRLGQVLLVPALNETSALKSLLSEMGGRFRPQPPLSGGQVVYLVELPGA
jgi:hypothetical protein